MNTKWLYIIAAIALTPVALFEYFVLFWFWGGDGTFTFFATPIAFVAYVLVHMIFMRRIPDGVVVRTALKLSLVLITPLLSMATVWLIARIAGITILIQ